MKKLAAILFLLVLIFAVIALSCIGSGIGDNSSVISGSPEGNGPGVQATIAAGATATYGAEQFQIQLTAIANEGQKVSP